MLFVNEFLTMPRFCGHKETSQIHACCAFWWVLLMGHWWKRTFFSPYKWCIYYLQCALFYPSNEPKIGPFIVQLSQFGTCHMSVWIRVPKMKKLEPYICTTWILPTLAGHDRAQGLKRRTFFFFTPCSGDECKPYINAPFYGGLKPSTSNMATNVLFFGLYSFTFTSSRV